MLLLVKLIASSYHPWPVRGEALRENAIAVINDKAAARARVTPHHQAVTAAIMPIKEKARGSNYK